MLIERRWYGLEPVRLRPAQLPVKQLHARHVSDTDTCFKQLDPGTSVTWGVDMPPAYFEHLRPGSFEILWKGGDIPLWNWGTLAEWCDSPDCLAPNTAAAILPGGFSRSLEVTTIESDPEDDVPEYPSSPDPTPPSARMNNAPLLSISIAGPARASIQVRDCWRPIYTVTVTVSYEADSNSLEVGDSDPPSNTGRPVTFRTSIFKRIDRHYDGFRLYRIEEDEWRAHELSTVFQAHHAYMYAETEPFNVGHNEEEFQSLKPGESWTFTRQVTDFPKNLLPGQRFRYGFKGATLDWWDWGSLQDHADTVVWICVGAVQRPKDNEGRSALVVPASNWIEFNLDE
ncbi:uncharacterized protein N7506_011099 [Penicillium brevicompactum]|uniref:uncharacterized protein n=1 Tax=Penicillium brevicompactum TaxID=5074 RepID=UPI0025421A03|nr:uncharacterized protein N7506_011099 [Penicillium brevicompactum]KAJ5321969.1 hypothetical protein N7506_011099 [Penicillium brevicompactum]